MAYTPLITATLAQHVNRIVARLGLNSSTDPAGSTDPSMTRLVAAINDASMDLASMYPWQSLVREATLTVQADTPGQTEKGYALPDDFFSWTSLTQMDRTSRLRAMGPIAGPQWQSIKLLAPGVGFRLMWRVKGSQITFLAPPTTARTFSYEYISAAFVQDGDTPTNYKSEATKNNDIILLDEYLVRLLATAKWQEASGFDSSASWRNFQLAYNQRVGSTEDAPMLATGGDAIGVDRLLTILNAPQVGYGS